MSLIQTTVPNVYHKINKIDEQEIRDIQENQDLTIPVFELYKEYYEYNVIDVKKEQLQIINSSNPAPNNYNTWIRSVEDIKTAEDVFKTAFEEGVLVLKAGKNTLRLLPALTISKNEMDEGFKRLERALNKIKKS